MNATNPVGNSLYRLFLVDYLLNLAQKEAMDVAVNTDETAIQQLAARIVEGIERMGGLLSRVRKVCDGYPVRESIFEEIYLDYSLLDQIAKETDEEENNVMAHFLHDNDCPFSPLECEG